jgi:hypothetical protein
MSSFLKEYADDPDNEFIVYCYLTTLGKLFSSDAKVLVDDR